MDPDTCFSELLEAIAANERQNAYDHAENLLMWLERGGFSPGGGKLRDNSIHDFCNWAKSQYPMEE